LKDTILQQLNELVSEKIRIAETAVSSAVDARDSDSKSSAGDKHETGRAMMQIELENNQKQLAKAKQLEEELSRINISRPQSTVALGSMVHTSNGNYFISIGLGKVDGCYAISLASPIGQALQGHQAGDTIDFQGKELKIVDIA